MNGAFDSLNSRRLSDFDFKKAISEGKFLYIKDFVQKFTSYVQHLRLMDGTYKLNSPRHMGFLGLIVELHSLQKCIRTPKRKENRFPFSQLPQILNFVRKFTYYLIFVLRRRTSYFSKLLCHLSIQ